MYGDFDYYSLIKDGPLEDDRWHSLPEGGSDQPEELFSAPWAPVKKAVPTYTLKEDDVVQPVDEAEVEAYLLELVKDAPGLDDDDIFLFILRTMEDPNAFIAGMKEYETAILERDEHVLDMIYSATDLLFETAGQYYDLGWNLGAEYVYRLLCLVGYQMARARLGAMVRRGETDSGYTVMDALRLLVVGVKCDDPVSAMHGVLMTVPPLHAAEGDWSLAEQGVRAFTPTGAYKVKEHWANWDLCGFIEGPLVHFLLILFGKIEPPSETAFADLYRQVRLHFPSIDHLICDRKNCRFWDPAGKEWKVLICGEKWGDEYVIYTDLSRDENGAVSLRAGRAHPVEGWRAMCPLETEEEQNFIRELLEQLRKEVNEKQQTETE